MVLKMFSIRDAKSELFNIPFMKATEGEAERDFRSVVNDEKSFPHKYPEDFDLYHLGTYDDNTGKVEPLDTPRHMVKAIQLVNPQP